MGEGVLEWTKANALSLHVVKSRGKCGHNLHIIVLACSLDVYHHRPSEIFVQAVAGLRLMCSDPSRL